MLEMAEVADASSGRWPDGVWRGESNVTENLVWDGPVPNISSFVFDMGGVLMDFDTTLFADMFTDSERDARDLERALFRNSAWALLDAGVISEATMEQIARARLPEKLWPTLHRTFSEWERYQPVLEAMNEQVRRLHAAGYGCYLLSNAGVRWWKQQERIPAMSCMDGFVVSAFERVMKPDVLIYHTLCERYGLKPSECLFVDDSEDNCAGAELAGMYSYHYDGRADAFERYVTERLGISY